MSLRVGGLVYGTSLSVFIPGTSPRYQALQPSIIDVQGLCRQTQKQAVNLIIRASAPVTKPTTSCCQVSRTEADHNQSIWGSMRRAGQGRAGGRGRPGQGTGHRAQGRAGQEGRAGQGNPTRTTKTTSKPPREHQH